MLFVNEIFASIQGEGRFTGVCAVFIRLQGCPVHCPWCDTKYTWKLPTPNAVPIDVALQKVDAPQWASVQESELVSTLQTRFSHIDHIVITGGEPCLYDLRSLTRALIQLGKSVQIETSGTSPILVDDACYVTVSPKVDMPSGLNVRLDALTRANEIKMPVGNERDLERLEALLAQLTTPKPKTHIVLQPISTDPEATQLCYRYAMQKGYGLSIQTHKYICVR